MRKRSYKPVLIRSTNKERNSLITRKIKKRINKLNPKSDLRIKRQGQYFYIDKSVR